MKEKNHDKDTPTVSKKPLAGLFAASLYAGFWPRHLAMSGMTIYLGPQLLTGSSGGVEGTTEP